MKKETSCCFTGHRPNKLPWGNDETDPGCVALKLRLRAELERAYERGFRHFITGMALGCDLYFCEAALALRETRPDVTVEAALPCEEQASRWGEAERQRYFSLIERCNYESMVQRAYDRGCMQRRNRYMVDKSSLLIAVYDGMLGGTMYTVDYALRRGVEVIMFAPDEA